MKRQSHLKPPLPARFLGRMAPPAILLALVLPAGAQGFGVRGDLRIVGSYLEYQTVVRRSLPQNEVPGDGLTRRLEDGTWVTCIPGGDCYWYESGPMEESTPLIQELRLTSWAGPRGVSAHLHLRSRFGGDGFWPREEQDFEALSAYVELERPAYRVSAGRLTRRGGLGYHIYDGAAATWKRWRRFHLEAFAGWSRGRTLNQPRTGSLLEEAEEFPPDERSVLWGGEGRVHLGREFDASLLYQREIRTDRHGLYSERMAFDASWRPRPVQVDFTADFDVASAEFNDTRLRLTRDISSALHATLQGRHYSPFFELWTIWGAFSPVAYEEASATVHWTVAPAVTAWGRAAYRDYGDTGTEADFLPVEGGGWRASGGGSWTPEPWSLSARLGYTRGYGAFQSSFDLFAGRRFASGAYLGVFAQTSQRFAEFRFGEGVTRGAGVQGDLPLGRLAANASLGLYRHAYEDRPRFEDFGQLRGRLALSYEIGSDPGLRSGDMP